MRTFLPILLLLAAPHAGAADLTEQEARWLTAAAPVLSYSQQLKLPVDVIVQPTSAPGSVPLAMGFTEGRCKLVVSLRGNPDAEAILKGVPESARGELIEAMAAHELGHCWRYAQGAWHALPAGFVEVGEQSASDKSLLAAAREMRENRREEGYADLVALAWTRHRHPADYDRIYSWLDSVRREQPVAGGGHDTRAWVKLAGDGAAFGAAAAPFDDAAPLWRKGLLSDN
jgi:ADP-ribose pyrophosphatase YjhB (NUDIX family)